MTERAKETVLVLTNPCDVVADRVVFLLREKQCPVARFDPAEMPQRSTITMGVGTDGMPPFLYRNWGPGIRLDEVKSIWYRKPGEFVLPTYSSSHVTRFAMTELTMALGGVLRSLDCFWMNSPGAMVEASYKVGQLARAHKLGLHVPDTIVTSQAATAKGFFERYKPHVIIKALGDPNIYAPDEGPEIVANIFTSRVAEADLVKFDRVTDAPVLLQEEIAKQADIRVTIVGDAVFAVSIDSQGRSESVTDWRKGGAGLPHHVIELPQTLEKQLLNLVASYGLSYAAIDMALDKSGDYVFLELNPNGEWGWLERVADLDISTAVVATLISGGAPSSSASS